MGIKNLWKALEPVSQKHSMLELTTNYALKGCETNSQHKFILGMDAKSYAFCIGHAQSGKNPKLQTLFYKLTRLHGNLIDVILVFDEDEWPPVKRSKHVVTTQPWLTQCLMDFVGAFGFSSYTAPGEAEAELAKLNQNGVIDGILTEDSDAVVFGAETVIQRKNEDGIICYSSSEIQGNGEVRLSDGGLLLMALVCGGDYHPSLLGCGCWTALQLAKYGLGDDLLHVAKDVTIGDLASYAKTWADELCLTLIFLTLLSFLLTRPPITSDMETAIALLGSPKHMDAEWLGFLCEFQFGWSRY
ncbi:PIN domain-like protein [Gyrodon lividus]|nr:PIN domain-like protein [Gyrodon lividus]